MLNSVSVIPEMLTSSEVAATLRIAEYTVCRKCKNGELPGAVKVFNDRWLIPRATIAAILGGVK